MTNDGISRLGHEFTEAFKGARNEHNEEVIRNSQYRNGNPKTAS